MDRNYYLPSVKKDVEAYVKGCNVYLALKAVKYKPYSNLQMLLIERFFNRFYNQITSFN